MSEFTQGRQGDLRRVVHQEVHVILFTVELDQVRAEVGADVPHDLFAARQHVVVEDFTPVPSLALCTFAACDGCREVWFVLFPDGVLACTALVFHAGWPAGACGAGFRCAGQLTGFPVEAAKSSADTRGCAGALGVRAAPRACGGLPRGAGQGGVECGLQLRARSSGRRRPARGVWERSTPTSA